MMIKSMEHITNTTYLKLIALIFVFICNGCIWGEGHGSDHTFDILIENKTSDSFVLQVYVDSTQIKTNDPLDDYELLPDSIVYIGGGGSNDFNYKPVQEYLENYRREAYVVRKKGVIVKHWLKDKDQTGHSPYNIDSWEVYKIEDDRGWIKFTIEESDLKE